jgi:hypothetical protein
VLGCHPFPILTADLLLSIGAADDTVRRQSLFNMRRWFGLLKGSPRQPTP